MSQTLVRTLSSPLAKSSVDGARTMARHVKAKKEGDISSVFVSLSGSSQSPLPDRFTDLKQALIQGHEDSVTQSWHRLLSRLALENDVVANLGPRVVPQIEFADIHKPSEEFKAEVKKRGVAVIKGVIPEAEARGYKEEVEAYVKANPWTKAFPDRDPQVFELYWSKPQVRARSHANIIAAQQFLMSFWHSKDDQALISTSQPLAYADRVRIRQPGDSGFALGPHVDGGSVERWEPNGYGAGHVYDNIWQGRWEEYDPWESSCRVPVCSDLYEGAGSCSMFRMFQGWLGMSHTGPNEGTLKVNPLLQLSTAYFLLRPFFSPRKSLDEFAVQEHSQDFLDAENWVLKDNMTSDLQGASLGHMQELNDVLHPHLDLQRTMIHIPQIKPGDFVVWHCDTIHAVDKVHQGKSDSSVMYIPVCPVTEANAEYVARQRDTFNTGLPGPDFPGGKGESEHTGRPTASYLQQKSGAEGLRAMGLEKLQTIGLAGEKHVLQMANRILGF